MLMTTLVGTTRQERVSDGRRAHGDDDQLRAKCHQPFARNCKRISSIGKIMNLFRCRQIEAQLAATFIFD